MQSNRSEESQNQFTHRQLRSEPVRPECCPGRQGPDIRECYLKLILNVTPESTVKVISKDFT